MLQRLQVSMLATRRFTADAGHELRTPLTGLGMELETLRDNPGMPAAERAEVLQAMTEEHTRVVRLFDGLQRLARGDAGALPHATTIDVADLAAAAVDAARRRHPRTRLELDDELDDRARIQGWTDGLRSAIDNLLDNAALHGRPGGTVDVQLRERAGEVSVSVNDDGPGIASPEHDAMRQRFARGSRPQHAGSGLGLAIVDQQARLHGGRLTLETSVAGGLRATIVIPLAHS
jgi:signal transduction histidine kinase